MVRNHRNRMKELLRELAEHVEHTALPSSGQRVPSERLAAAGDAMQADAALNVPQQSIS
jgi:hypothetical protein